jgi:hypothetical protein
MDGPISLQAIWHVEYAVDLSSQHGNPLGAGWHSLNEVARISVESIIDGLNGTRVVAAGWTGDAAVTGNNGSVVVTSPVEMSVVWVSESMVEIRYLDAEGRRLSPDAVELTGPRGQRVIGRSTPLWLEIGPWVVDGVEWRGHDVTPSDQALVVAGPGEHDVACEVSDLKVTVVDAIGVPVSNAEARLVLSDGQGLGTRADLRGSITFLMVPKGEHVLSVSALGMEAVMPVKIQGRGASLPMRLPLSPISAVGLAVVAALAGTLVLNRILRSRRRGEAESPDMTSA